MRLCPHNRTMWVLALRFGVVGVISCLAGGAVAAPAGWAEAQVLRVVDGDSLWVRPAAGGAPWRLRLRGLDAPEICQAHGRQARESLAAHLALGGQRVRVERLQRDHYNRWLARVQTTDGDVGAWLVGQGLAWSDGDYRRQEAMARAQRRGLFAQAQPERPRDFRRRHGPCEPPRPATEQRGQTPVFPAFSGWQQGQTSSSGLIPFGPWSFAMKIQNHSPAMAALQRDGAKPAHAPRADKSQPEAAPAPTPSVTLEVSGKTAPPGLQRVLAKLEALGEEGRSRGQNQAMDRVARNLARYQENQSVAPLPLPPEPLEPPVEAPAESPVEVPVEPPVVEVSEPPVVEAGAEPPEPETPDAIV